MITPISFKRVNLTTDVFQKPWLRYAGNPKCPYIEWDVYLAIEMAARTIYYEFPDRPDRTLWLGDACPFTGGCSSCGELNTNGGRCGGHPSSSHSHRRSIDFNYYTFAEFDPNNRKWGNITQYAPKGMSWTSMWEDTDNMILKPGVFDAERNMRLVLILKNLLGIDPTVRYGTQEVLKAEMSKLISDRDTKIKFNLATGEVSGTTYNHHTHAHVVLKNPMDWHALNLKPYL